MQTHCILILRHYRANRAQFAEVAFHTVSDEDVQEIPLPSMHSTAEDDSKHYLSPRRWKLCNILVVIEGLAALTTQDAPVDVFSTPPQLDGELVTLTLLPRSRWQTLLNLDVIQVSNISRPFNYKDFDLLLQQRNKPKEPPKAPEKAPFFLPTLPGVETQFVIEPTEKRKEQKAKTRRLENATAHVDSVFSKKLLAESASGDCMLITLFANCSQVYYSFLTDEGFFSYVKTLTPAALDLELRSVVSLENIDIFINALTQRLSSHRDFEAVQALQNVFLRMHADVLIENLELRQRLERLAAVQRDESQRVLDLITSSLGTLGFVRDVQ